MCLGALDRQLKSSSLRSDLHCGLQGKAFVDKSLAGEGFIFGIIQFLRGAVAADATAVTAATTDERAEGEAGARASAKGAPLDFSREPISPE